MNPDYPSFLWHFNYPLDRNAGEFARLDEHPGGGDYAGLIRRIISAFRLASGLSVGDSDNVWLDHFANVSAGPHKILGSGSEAEIADLLNDPVSSTLFHGFDGINAADQTQLDQPWWRWFSAAHTYDMLMMLTQAVGALPLENPEAGMTGLGPGVEDLLEALDPAFGFRIDFPNPFRGELGIRSSRGLISTRAVAALHQVWRIASLVDKHPGARVAEIGGGLGRNAFYARKFGIVDYMLVDLPTTNVAQANWLGRVLPPEELSLWGEPGRADTIRIVPPESFLAETGRFDLVVNVDSMTEFSESTAIEYLEKIVACSSTLLSINHEANSFQIGALMKTLNPYVRPSRHPWWIKRGYVEEVFQFGKSV